MVSSRGAYDEFVEIRRRQKTRYRELGTLQKHVNAVEAELASTKTELESSRSHFDGQLKEAVAAACAEFKADMRKVLQDLADSQRTVEERTTQVLAAERLPVTWQVAAHNQTEAISSLNEELLQAKGGYVDILVLLTAADDTIEKLSRNLDNIRSVVGSSGEDAD